MGKQLPSILVCLLMLSCGMGERDWQLASHRTEGHFAPITALSFTDALSGWAATPSGLLSTSDGGVTWLEAKTGDGIFSAIQVQFESARSGAAIGTLILGGKSSAAVLSTSDGGATWSENPVPTPQTLVAAEFCAEGIVLVATERTVVRSPDAGKTWSIVLELEEGQRFSGLACSANGEALATAQRGAANFSTDKGQTWRPTQVPCSTPWMRARYVQEELWVVGPHGCVALSLDRGVSWKALPAPPVYTYFDVGGVAGERWLVGAGGLLLASRNGGLTWDRKDSQVEVDLATVFTGKDGQAWIGGAQATVLTYR